MPINKNMAVIIKLTFVILIIPGSLFFVQETRQYLEKNGYLKQNEILIVKLLTSKLDKLYKNFINNIDLTFIKHIYQLLSQIFIKYF